jgi:hypothetical protein
MNLRLPSLALIGISASLLLVHVVGECVSCGLEGDCTGTHTIGPAQFASAPSLLACESLSCARLVLQWDFLTHIDALFYLSHLHSGVGHWWKPGFGRQLRSPSIQTRACGPGTNGRELTCRMLNDGDDGGYIQCAPGLQLRDTCDPHIQSECDFGLYCT